MYKPIELNYEYNGLEPYISGETIFLHYEKHYKGYLDRLNKVLEKNNFDFKDDVAYVIKNIDKFPIEDRDTILFNAGGVINHELYFENMNKKGSHIPFGDLKQAIDNQYGNYDNFKTEFKNKASKLVGSGYTFLVLDNYKKLNIINMSNQESPYSYDMIPLMALDLWEHAYYLDYQNLKNAYINNFFEIVSFDKVNEKYKETIKK